MPMLVASAQIACPVAIPSAVKMPPARPPSSVLRTVTAVSGPGVTMTSTEMPRKAKKEPIAASLSVAPSSNPSARRGTNAKSAGRL